VSYYEFLWKIIVKDISMKHLTLQFICLSPLLTFISVFGALLSSMVIAMGYGLLDYTLLQTRNQKNPKLIEE
jgi:hypothetical protein